MKIRDGFVTNSSSTNFLIISKEALTKEYLFRKLGFTEDSPIEAQGWELCKNIIEGFKSGLRWFNITEYNKENIEEAFGKSAAEKYEELSKKGYIVYAGHTDDSEYFLTLFFTLDSFVIDDKDFYLNAENCAY